VSRVVPLPNRHEAASERRYLIDAVDVRRVEAGVTAPGEEVVGAYHSHPGADVDARPSAFDLAHAWPWYAYLIVSVVEGSAGELRIWRLADDRARFQELSLELEEDRA
jgi:proteasome lid subunit RPN8/RPN11